MNWIKMGLIYHVSNYNEWAYSHTHKPTLLLFDENRLRIYLVFAIKKTEPERHLSM